jgi:protein-S-isoprenylcysteine O-methyltransferase Ste14
MRSADGDAALIPPPILGTAWGGVQLALTMVAGGRRRFRGQPLIAGALAAGATALGATALGLFRRSGTTFHPQHPDEATALVTDGVYAYTRNPMYVSMLVMLLAGSVASGRLRTLVALPGMVASLQPQLQAEEAALGRLFGDDYVAYRQRVRRWL